MEEAFNLSSDPMKSSSDVTDSYPSSSGSLTVDPVGVVQTEKSLSGNYLTADLAVSHDSEENVLLNEGSNRGDRAIPAGDTERELNGSRNSFVNPKKIAHASRRLARSKRLDTCNRLSGECSKRRKSNRAFKSMHRNGVVAAYSATAVPKLRHTNDVVSAIIDMRESLSPMRFRSLHPQYDKPTREQYCAAMQAIMGLS